MIADEFLTRRQKTASLMGGDSVAVLHTGPVIRRSADSNYPYRVDSDFYYLTGFAEPMAVAVIAPNHPEGEFILFCQEPDPVHEQWEGRRTGVAAAKELYRADQAFPLSRLDELMPSLLSNRTRLAQSFGANVDFDQRMAGWLQQIRGQQKNGYNPPIDYVSLHDLLAEQRVIKSSCELNALKESAALAIEGHLSAMRATKPGVMEYAIAAEAIHAFHRNGAIPAYWPIVAAGSNACILHYRDNNSAAQDGDLLLIDAGCERAYYASDVTRTFPVSGRFSAEQRAIYDVVLNAQRAAIKACRPGAPWNQPHDAAVEAITEGLVELKLLSGRVPDLIDSGAYRKFFMHKTGHWLGIDVHDVGRYKINDEWRVLEPGMVMTIEPGIYLSAHHTDVPARYRGIGIRIEDDVVVTDGGAEVLSAGLVKEPDEIEEFMMTNK